jgi:hypothetical protein
VQTPLPADCETLDALLHRELARAGDGAIDSVADAIAAMHRLRFFHGDLKGFHAFPEGVVTLADAPARYRLRWVDLGRVGFRLSRRQRVINLYQVLRYLLPSAPAAQERFMRRYCAATGWHADTPERGLAVVRRFLARKLRTHPEPWL